MNLHEKLKETYQAELAQRVQGWKERAEELNLAGAQDDSIMEKIKINVGEIFLKMFEVSYNNVYGNPKIKLPSMGGALTGGKEELLKKTYLEFFNKIPAPWKIKAEKDKQHNMHEEYHKECLKLETAEDIKALFLRHFEALEGEKNA